MIQYNVDGFEIYEYPAPDIDEQKNAIFFAHANGIPALTYNSLFEKLSKQLNCMVISYDMRGIGKTTNLPLFSKKNKTEWSWDILVEDYISLFNKIKSHKSTNLTWILTGHSLGAWIALLASKVLLNFKLFLFEPPILAPKIIIQWSMIVLFNKRHLSPRGRKVKKRKTKFLSSQIAYQELKKSSLMQNWSEEVIRDYVEGSFSEEKNGGEASLRHDPSWEALMFEDYPMAAWRGFIKVPYNIRRNLNIIFFVGENSDTCNPKAKKWVQLFFPKMKWITIKNGTHMFPLEMQFETITNIKNHL